MRFTPNENCKVEAARVFSYIAYGSPETCSLFVWDDKDGKPGAPRVRTTYLPTHRTWDEIEFTSPLIYDTDFWIGIWIPPVGTNIIGAATDDGLDHPDRDAWRKRSGSWYAARSAGDFMIRAVVSYVGIEEEKLCTSERVILNQNFPNPILNETAISYALPEEMNVELKVYDITGKLVRTLVDAIQSPGLKKVVWDRKNRNGETISSGIYFYRLSIDESSSFTKIMAVL